MHTASIAMLMNDGLDFKPYNLEVGAPTFVIGVRGNYGSDLDNFLAKYSDQVELVERFPEVLNTKYCLSHENEHQLQPALIRRTK